MNNVRRPKKINLVTHPVKPIIKEIDTNKKKYPYPYRGRKIKYTPMFINIFISEEKRSLHKDAGELLTNSLAQIWDTVIQPVIAKLFVEIISQLNPDENEKHGHRQGYVVNFHLSNLENLDWILHCQIVTI